MSLMPFASSRPLTLGVELELQLLSCNDYNLSSSAPDILRRVARHDMTELLSTLLCSYEAVKQAVCQARG